MLIREPELGYNTENKRVPRGGRARKFYYSGSYQTGHAANKTLARSSRKKREAGKFYKGTYVTGHGSNQTTLLSAGPQRRREKRDAEDEDKVMIEENAKVTLHSKAWWADLLDGFAEMTDPVSSDLALFLYCMLN